MKPENLETIISEVLITRKPEKSRTKKQEEDQWGFFPGTKKRRILREICPEILRRQEGVRN